MKSRKLVSIVLVMAMIFSMVAFAGAATFADVTGATDSAVSRLAGLGILAGYPDGTFKPNNNITRAEFAKVAVTAMGLDTTAGLLVNVNSKFADVATGKWYTGYVNLATNLGILKGYPDGKFRPDANISEAEAVTMVLRLLGYNDNLAGDWPFDYIVQGNLLNLISSGFNATAKATRGTVATWVSKALDATLVTYDKEANTFNNVTTGATTLLAKGFTGTVSAGDYVLVASITRATGDTKYHTLTVGTTGYNVSKEVKVANGTFGEGLANHRVKYTTKKIDTTDVIVAIDVLSTSVTGKVTKVVTADKKVTIGTTVVTYGDSVTLPSVNDEVTVYIYDGKVYLSTASSTLSGKITGKSSQTVTDASGTRTVNSLTVQGAVYTNTYEVAADASIKRNGAVATFADLKAGDSVDYKLTSSKFSMISAWYVTVEGIVNSWTKDAAGKFKTVTIDGVTYNVATTFADSVTVGVKATFSLNEKNEITGKVGSDAAATTVVGTLAGTSIGSDAEGDPVYFVSLTNGVSYDVSNAVTLTALKKNLSTVTFANLFAKNGAIKISYSAAGKVTSVDVFEPNAVFTTKAAALATKQDSTTFTSNGKTVTALPDDAVGRFYRVAWDGVTGKATSISAVLFDVVDKAVTAKSVVVDGSTTTRQLTVTGIAAKDLTANAVILKDGVVSNFDAIALGDIASFAYDATETTKIAYIEVVTPAAE